MGDRVKRNRIFREINKIIQSFATLFEVAAKISPELAREKKE